ncbi:MAG: DNA polymerase III subunit chi [Hyphomicrobiales bacterium]|nr:DNA polymerase III subunit chi [Hyphomicrobiales bacterium]
MTEFRFHHLERFRVDQALPHLLERACEAGRRIIVRAPSDEMVAALNDRLWTYDDASFLPHGAAGDGESASHPIFLTARAENPNNAKMLVLLSGAEASPEDDAFEEVLFLFDGRHAGAVAEARARWKALKDERRTLSYWREGEDGWERAR